MQQAQAAGAAPMPGAALTGTMGAGMNQPFNPAAAGQPMGPINPKTGMPMTP